MAALNRFVARRGKPQSITSDNGTNFVGASNDLQRFLSNQDEMVGIHRRGQAWTAGAHQGEDPATALVTRAGREDLSRRGWHHQGGRIEDQEGDHTSSLQLHLPASTSLKKMTLQPGEYVGASRVLGLHRDRSAIIGSARGAGTLRTCPTPTQPHDRHRCQTRPSHVGAN
ncbi:uncharacterized protein LOC135086861 isoform X1 [Ostrinia nubilalis]|uniref:uncharacterized protein LOC135086861 isoform X1 n=1 Tax=Ostrinia nubilalis TaxID=29057 RepID=UPI0030826992